jgi:hypothetical protein
LLVRLTKQILKNVNNSQQLRLLQRVIDFFESGNWTLLNSNPDPNPVRNSNPKPICDPSYRLVGVRDPIKALDFPHFSILIPSRLRIEFLQKNIRQLNVEFIKTKVFDQMLNNLMRLSFGSVSDVKDNTEYIICGKEQTKKQPIANEHVEMLLKFINRLFLC